MVMIYLIMPGQQEKQEVIHKEKYMKAKITAKSELRLSDLTREYTFDIVDDDKLILTSQVITSRPSEVVGQIQNIVAEYQTVYEDTNDVEVGEEV